MNWYERLSAWAADLAWQAPHFTKEQWIDVVTLSLLAVTFFVMFFVSLRRTYRWDTLGRALSALSLLFALSYLVVVVSALLSYNLWVPEVRWIYRVSALIVGMTINLTLLANDPGKREAWDGSDRRDPGVMGRRAYDQERGR